MSDKKKKRNPFSLSSKYFGDYLIMLIAPCVMAWYYCGERALTVLLVSVASAVFCDLIGGLLLYNELTVRDLCAVFTGASIALMMPSTVPYYIPAVASAFAIVIVKLPLGGALKAPVIPAAAGFAFACVCFSAEVFSYPPAATSASGQFVSGVSLAAMLQKSSSMHLDLISSFDILSGSVSGAMGTGCAIVLIGCAVYLVFRRPHAAINTGGFLLSCCVMALAFPRVNTGRLSSLILELCSGTLLFAAVFFITDPATSPKSPFHRFFYGIYAGVLTMLMRYFGVYEEGVCFAVILANCSWSLIASGLDKLALLIGSIGPTASGREAAK